MSAYGTKQTLQPVRLMSAIGGKADMPIALPKCPLMTHKRHRPASHVAVANPISGSIAALLSIATMPFRTLGMSMKRREFITLLGGAAAWPIVARAQQAQQKLPLVGFLNSASPDTYRFNADLFREGLAKAGFVDGRNVRIEERWARSDYDALPGLAAELVAMGAVAIAATGDVASARAAQRASSTIPVVFTIGGDPVRFGLVKSVNRPGGNVTGVLFNQNVLAGKRVELLKEVAPRVTRVALLMNPTNPNVKIEIADAEAGAKKLGLETIALLARNAQELDAAFEQLLSAKADGLISGTDPIVLDRREQVVSSQAPRRIFRAPVYGCWRALELWTQHQLDVSSGRGLRRPNSKRGQSGGHARAAAHGIRDGDQPQDSARLRHQCSAHAAGGRQRRDRLGKVYSGSFGA